MDLIKLQGNLAKLDVIDIAVQIFDDMDSYIADLNRVQLVAGQNDEGEFLQPEYADITTWLKQMYGKGTGSIIDRVTLYDTGDLHKSIFSSMDGKVLTLDSKDGKVDELEAKYGNFLGLTKQSQELVKDEFLKRFEIKLSDAILQ